MKKKKEKTKEKSNSKTTEYFFIYNTLILFSKNSIYF